MRPHTTLCKRFRLASCPCTACGDSGARPLQVSLLPTIDGRLFRLAHGNAQLPRALLAGCGANETRARVAEVARERDGSYTLTLATREGSPDEQVCCVRASSSRTGLALCMCGPGSRGDACNLQANAQQRPTLCSRMRAWVCAARLVRTGCAGRRRRQPADSERYSAWGS